MAKKQADKIEVLFDVSLSGERVKECDFVDFLNDVLAVGKKYPDARTIVIDPVKGMSWPMSFYIVYRALDKPIRARDARRLLKKFIEARMKELGE